MQNRDCVLEQFFVLQSCSQLNKLTHSMHNTPVYCSFQAVQLHQIRNFHFFYPFFEFGGHFGMKKVLMTHIILIFFKILVKLPLKSFLLFEYLFFLRLPPYKKKLKYNTLRDFLAFPKNNILLLSNFYIGPKGKNVRNGNESRSII